VFESIGIMIVAFGCLFLASRYYWPWIVLVGIAMVSTTAGPLIGGAYGLYKEWPPHILHIVIVLGFAWFILFVLGKIYMDAARSFFNAHPPNQYGLFDEIR